ncbi:hypothetical protein ACWCIB_10610 [SAR92 clade bacterium H246]
MKRFNTIFAIVLSLVIGLGSVTATAHTHTDHQENSCPVSVLQNASAAVTDENSTTFVTATTTAVTIHNHQAVSNRVRGCHHARAPPLTSK